MNYFHFQIAQLLYALSFSVATLAITGKHGNLEITYQTSSFIFLPKHLMGQLHTFFLDKNSG